MFGTPPTGEQIAYDVQVSFDSRAPKMKLSLISYLLDAGVLPDMENPEPFYALVKGLLDIAKDGFSEYLEEIRSGDPSPATEQIVKDMDPIQQAPPEPERGGPYL